MENETLKGTAPWGVLAAVLSAFFVFINRWYGKRIEGDVASAKQVGTERLEYIEQLKEIRTERKDEITRLYTRIRELETRVNEVWELYTKSEMARLPLIRTVAEQEERIANLVVQVEELKKGAKRGEA
jgi:TolA-binding protein